MAESEDKMNGLRKVLKRRRGGGENVGMGLWLEINQDLETNHDLETKQGSHTSRFKRMTFRVFKISRFFSRTHYAIQELQKITKPTTRSKNNKKQTQGKKIWMNSTATVHYNNARMNSTAIVVNSAYEQYLREQSFFFVAFDASTQGYDFTWKKFNGS